VDGNDVENAVWRFLCMARDKNVGFEKARAQILPIKDDRRVPMMQVYGLFAGKLTADDVLGAVRADKPSEPVLRVRMFYANLYLGLYHEAQGDGKLAKPFLEAAAEAPIDHYMGDVAKVHAKLVRGS
jgi:lipoprotein NlpI